MPKLVLQFLALVVVILLVLTLLNWLFSALLIGLKLALYLCGIAVIAYVLYQIFRPKH